MFRFYEDLVMFCVCDELTIDSMDSTTEAKR